MLTDENSPDPELTLEAFMVGSSNAEAYDLATQSAAALDSTFLGLVGPPGIGKSHLLHAVGNVGVTSGRIVTYVECRDLVSVMLLKESASSATDLREQLRRSTLILVDNLHHLDGKQATTSAVAELLIRFRSEGTGIMVAGNPGPGFDRLMGLLDDAQVGFRSVSISSPDLLVRQTIVDHAAGELNLAIGTDVADYVTGFVTGSIREIHGAIRSLAAYAGAHRVPLSRELAISLLDDRNMSHDR